MHGQPDAANREKVPIYYIKRFRGKNKPENFAYMRFFTKKDF